MSGVNGTDSWRERKELRRNDGVPPMRQAEVASFVRERDLADNRGRGRADGSEDSGETADAHEGMQLSLDPDSPEYQELIADRSGLTEQDQLDLGKDAIRYHRRPSRDGMQAEGKHDADEWHEEYSRGTVAKKQGMEEDYVEGQRSLQPNRFVGSRVINKMTVLDQMKHLGREAASTRGGKDDLDYEQLVKDASDLGKTDIAEEAQRFEREVEDAEMEQGY